MIGTFVVRSISNFSRYARALTTRSDAIAQRIGTMGKAMVAWAVPSSVIMIRSQRGDLPSSRIHIYIYIIYNNSPSESIARTTRQRFFPSLPPLLQLSTRRRRKNYDLRFFSIESSIVQIIDFSQSKFFVPGDLLHRVEETSG